MADTTHTCSNPCQKGKSGLCSGSCAADFLGSELRSRAARDTAAAASPSLTASRAEASR
ncbi:MAG: hypothetical protein AAGF48_06655 [Pseudomonadota bacterium]